LAEIVSIRKPDLRPSLHKRLEGAVLTVTLASPPANALSMALIGALQATLDEVREDNSIHVVVIAAEGKVFSGGHDLKELTAHRGDSDGGRAFFEQTFAACAHLMQSIVALPQPVIASVGGIATAAGCQLVASCDLAIASDRATFGVNGIDIGLFCSTPMVALTRKMSDRNAMEMLLTGEMVDASTAREFGLANRVVPPEYLDQVVAKYAAAIAAKSPLAIRMGKQAFYAQRGLPLADAYAHTSKVIVDNLMARDAQEGIDAFLTRRKPEWTGE